MFAESLIVVRMARHRRKLRISSWMLPYLVVILIFSVFVGAAAFYRPSQPQTPNGNKAQAKDYFQTFNATTDSYDIKTFRDTNGTFLKLYSLMFTIKAVGGPAHEVTASFSNADPVDALPFNLTQGQYGFIGTLRVSSSQPAVSELVQGKGFPFEVYITSLEAEGYIIVYMTIE